MMYFSGWENGHRCNFIGLVNDEHGKNQTSEHNSECRFHAALSGKPQIERCYRIRRKNWHFKLIWADSDSRHQLQSKWQHVLQSVTQRKYNTRRTSLEAFPFGFNPSFFCFLGGGRGGNLMQLNLKIDDNWR